MNTESKEHIRTIISVHLKIKKMKWKMRRYTSSMDFSGIKINAHRHTHMCISPHFSWTILVLSQVEPLRIHGITCLLSVDSIYFVASYASDPNTCWLCVRMHVPMCMWRLRYECVRVWECIRSANNNHLPNVFLGDAYKINSKQSRQANNWTNWDGYVEITEKKSTQTNSYATHQKSNVASAAAAAIADVVLNTSNSSRQCCSPARTTINIPIQI